MASSCISQYSTILILSIFFVIGMSSTIESYTNGSNYIIFTVEKLRPSAFLTQGEWHNHMISSLFTTKSLESKTRIFYSYNAVAKGFAARLTKKEAAKIEKMPGVSAVIMDTVNTIPHTTRSPQFLGLSENYGLWPTTRFGDDIIIGLVDTGIWPESASFRDNGLGPILGWTGSCEFESSLCNNKLIGAKSFTAGYRNFVADGLVENNDSGEYLNSPRDRNGHGTHTASTAAGAFVEGANIFGFADGKARGVAPNAKIAMYKACVGPTCADSDILAAMESAIQDGVHVLSLSIGGREGPYYNNIIARGAFAAVRRGIFVVCSAGNAGPSPYSVQNTAPWITTVGAASIDRLFPVHIILGNGRGFVGSSLYVSDSSTSTSESYTLVYVDDCENVNNNLKGKILVCTGEPALAVTVGFKLQEVGGKGFIHLNRADDGEGLFALPFPLPGAMVGVNEGLDIQDYISETRNPTGRFIFSNATSVGSEIRAPIVASFSSRGPNPIVPEILKPDLIAPGFNILAAFPPTLPLSFDTNDQTRSSFNIMSGTSMACPHVAGAAALLLAVHRNWSPAAIRSALMTTSSMTDRQTNPISKYEDLQTATPLDFGAGHINPELAVDPGLVYDADESDYVNFMCSLNYSADQLRLVGVEKTNPCSGNNVAGDLNYPSITVVLRQGVNVIEIVRTVTNVVESVPETYNVKIVNPGSNKVTISVDPGTLTFTSPMEKQRFVVKITGNGGRYLDEPVSGYIAWVSEKMHHYVQSPFFISWK